MRLLDSSSMDPSSIPAPTNDFWRWPTWNYASYYDVYCTRGVTVPGQQHIFIGLCYMAEYLFFTSLYIPSLIVIWRSHLFQHACYKLMFCIGIFDCIGGFFYAFMSGIFSIMAANYCDHNTLLIVVGHLAHGAWGFFCMSAVILALNRCIEVYSKGMADRLFGGRRVWFWSIPIVIYGVLFSSDYDVPPIYNSVWSCYLFQIDFRPGAPPVNDWLCFMNSCWVMSSLIVLYTLLLYGMWKYKKDFLKSRKSIKSMQKKVMLQSFVICGSVFLVAAAYASASFIRIPGELGKFATMALQLCSASTSIVYLTMNRTIRRGVLDLVGIGRATNNKGVFPTNGGERCNSQISTSQNHQHISQLQNAQESDKSRPLYIELLE